MNKFKDLIKKHDELVKNQKSGKSVFKEAKGFLEESSSAGADIIDPNQREQLRAYNRYWGNYFYEKTGEMPKTDLAPISQSTINRRNKSKQLQRILLLFLTLLLLLITSFNVYRFSTLLAPPSPIIAEASCPLETPDVNIYLAPPSIITFNNINLLATPTPNLVTLPTPDPNLANINLAKARYAAFNRLTYEVERWTDIQSIQVDDASEVKIMITFLHPDLIQAVALNNLLLNNPNVLSNTATAQQIDAEVRMALKQFAMRKKLIFLITILPTQKTETSLSHTISINIQEMILKNSKSMNIPPDYDDHNLDQVINPNDKPIFGYFYYPLAVMHNNNCTAVLSSQYDTKIVIETSSLIIDDTPGGAIAWTIPYNPLIEIATNYTPVIPDQLNLTPILPVNDPPQTNLSIAELKDNKGYWSEFARFVWAQLTFEVYNK